MKQVRSPFSRWSQRRRTRAAERDHWSAQQREHQARVNSVIAGADFRSWKSFYDDDPRRRAKEVALGEVSDGEFCWRIFWFPTTEVVAWPFRWRDERLHHSIYGNVAQRTLGPSHMGIGPAALPQIVYLVGQAESADEGKRRIACAASLAELRTALD